MSNCPEWIVVGSTNPTKVGAVRNIASAFWPDAVIQGLEVDSGVSAQPMSDNEMIQGALNRAQASLARTAADLAVGLEGGTVDTPWGMLLSGWVVALDRQGRRGIACAGSLLLPEVAAHGVRQGEELGPLMDKLLGEHDVKRRQGTVGVLTAGHVPRTKAFERGVIYALAPFVSPSQYARVAS